MHDPMTLEVRLAKAYGRYADGADADVAALDLAAAIATGSRRGRRPWNDLPARQRRFPGPGAPLAKASNFPCLQWLPEVSQ